MYNILYLGTKPIGEECFSELVNRQWKGLQLSAVCSHEKYDNYWYQGNSIYIYAQEKGIPFISNEKRNNEKINSVIHDQKIDLIISVGHPWIIPEDILISVNYNAYNLHLAKLPDYKGNFTYNHAILNEEKEYGVTLHKMVANVDEGEIFQMPIFPIARNDTAYSLYMKSLKLGVKIFVDFLTVLASGDGVMLQLQQGHGNFYDRHSLDGLRLINNVNDFPEVDRKARAFYFPPFENAYFYMCGRKYYVLPESSNWQKENIHEGN